MTTKDLAKLIGLKTVYMLPNGLRVAFTVTDARMNFGRTEVEVSDEFGTTKWIEYSAQA